MSQEQEPSITLQWGDREIEANRFNTSLYQFAGNLASRSHIFIETGETDDGRLSGNYMFASQDEESTYVQMINFMVQHNFPMHLNLSKVPDGDEKAYQSFVDQAANHAAESIGDFIPDGWSE